MVNSKIVEMKNDDGHVFYRPNTVSKLLSNVQHAYSPYYVKAPSPLFEWV